MVVKCNDLNLFLDIYPMGKGIARLYKENEDCWQFKETTTDCGRVPIFGIPYGEYRLEINQEGCEPCSCYFTVRAWGVFPMSPQLSLKKYHNNLVELEVELEPEKEDDNMDDCDCNNCNKECDYGEKQEITYISELIKATTMSYLKTMDTVLKTHFKPLKIYGIEGFGHSIEFKYKIVYPPNPISQELQKKIHEITKDYDVFVEEDEVTVTLNNVLSKGI